MTLLRWLAAFRETARQARPPAEAEPESGSRAPSGKYAGLYEYLEHRHADSVVLTFSEIEDLIGSGLPPEAQQDRAWWACTGSMMAARHADAWIFAHRSAVPNLPARTVVFDRAS